MYTHILYPTDGSDHSLNALPHVIKIAQAFEAKVSVLNVYSVPINLGSGLHRLPPEIFKQITSGLENDGEEILFEAKRRLQLEEIETDVFKMEGNPKLVICEFARQRKCDLIIMGSRGVDEIKSPSNLNLMGSSSVHVIIHTDGIPVLVVD